MEQLSADQPAGASAPARDVSLFLLCLTVFLGCLTVSLPLPVIPVFVRQELGFADWIVGYVTGVVAGPYGYRAVYWIAAAAALGGVATALSLGRGKKTGE